MLVIRFQRTGRRNLPAYRLVIAEKARAAKGKFLAIVGHYLPTQKPAVFVYDEAVITEWVGKGAIPSDTVARLLKKSGVKNMEKYIARYPKRKSKNAPAEEPAAAPAPAAPAAVAEAPAAPAPEVAAETSSDSAPAQA